MSVPLRPLFCSILLGVFVIDSPQCGSPRYDHDQLARMWMEEGRYGRALVEVKRALRQEGRTPALCLLEAIAHWGRGETEEAIRSLEDGLDRAPDDEQLHQVLREICQKKEDFDLARAAVEDLLEKHPRNGRLMATLGWAYSNLGKEERAIELLSSALAESDTLLFAVLQLGHLYLGQGRFEEAVNLLQQALMRSPEDERLLYLLGRCRLRQGRSEEAADVFERAMSRSRSPVATGTRIAQAYYEQGMTRRAIDYYERVVNSPEADALVFNNLAWAYAEEGIHLDKALDLSLRAVKSDPGNVVYLDTYAEVLYRKGQPERACAVMRLALEQEPEDGQQRAYLERQMAKFQKALRSSSG